MSELIGELARIREGFDRPTLRLLDRKWAPLVLGVFQTTFTRDQRSIAAERLHTQVDLYMEELRSHGEATPALTGRALCLQWMNDQWLFRNIGDGGQEEYSLTSHALEAMDLVQSLSRERALISESRINTILDTARRWATEADPDREARIERLDVQIRQLVSERERLAAGGDLAAASDDRMLDGYANLLDLIGQLPGDFKRVEESVLGMHRKIINDFRDEVRPIGEVIDEYLRRTDELTTLTAEGRAFEGAFMLLRDDGLLLDLRNDLRKILDHPFAQALTVAEQREFSGAVGVIRQGIVDVLAQRSRLTGTLRDHIVNHDVVRDRELDATLRQVNQRLAIWMESAGPRSVVPIPMIPTVMSIAHLRERFWDPGSAIPPPPLEDVSAGAPAAPTIEEIRTQGGPSLPQLRARLIAAVEAGDAASAGEVFDALPDDLRRPVEILGLLHLIGGLMDTVTDPDAADVPPDSFAVAPTRPDVGDVEAYLAIRPDGTTRTFDVPAYALTLRDAQRLAALDEGVLDD